MARFQKLRDSAYKSALGSNYLEQGRYAEALASTGAEPEAVDPKTPAVSLVESGARRWPGARDPRPGRPRRRRRPRRGDGGAERAARPAGRGGRASPTSTAKAGLAGVAASAAVAGDYDNDGQPDLLVVRPGGLVALPQRGRRLRFADATAAAGFPPSRTRWRPPPSWTSTTTATSTSSCRPRRRTGRPSSSRTTATGRSRTSRRPPQLGAAGAAVAVVPTDFDNRRDVDLFVLRCDRPVLFKNMRDGSFEDVAAELGLARAGAVPVRGGGRREQGRLHRLLPGGARRESSLALSDGRGALRGGARARGGRGRPGGPARRLRQRRPARPARGHARRGCACCATSGRTWADVSAAAFAGARRRAGRPRRPRSAAADLDGDGDPDALVATPRGPAPARERGRQPQPLVRACGSPGASSNRDGVGAKVEIRAGSLRQKLETLGRGADGRRPPTSSSASGAREAPDAVRIIWVSGIVQTETRDEAAAAPSRRAALAVTELDRKPSSCPYLYAWNGERFEFVTDFLGGGEMGYYVAPGVAQRPRPGRVRADRARAARAARRALRAARHERARGGAVPGPAAARSRSTTRRTSLGLPGRGHDVAAEAVPARGGRATRGRRGRSTTAGAT